MTKEERDLITERAEKINRQIPEDCHDISAFDFDSPLNMYKGLLTLDFEYANIFGMDTITGADTRDVVNLMTEINEYIGELYDLTNRVKAGEKLDDLYDPEDKGTEDPLTIQDAINGATSTIFDDLNDCMSLYNMFMINASDKKGWDINKTLNTVLKDINIALGFKDKKYIEAVVKPERIDPKDYEDIEDVLTRKLVVKAFKELIDYYIKSSK